MLDVVFDMETQDPDDYLTLLLLIGHPEVRLKAVTITPGSAMQVGLVRRTLSTFGLDIPVGAHNLTHPKDCISSWHAKAYGAIEPSWDAAPGGEVLVAMCDEETTLLTGAPLKNLGEAMASSDFRLGRWVAQGGFAGEGVVPAHLQLPKFKGLITCPTFNFNGAPQAALRALSESRIGEKRLISKNVCHGVVYNLSMHQEIAKACQQRKSLSMLWHGMDVYLQKFSQRRINQEIIADKVRLKGIDGEDLGVMPLAEAIQHASEAGTDLVELSTQGHPVVCKLQVAPDISQQGKKFHDPLAACCAIDPGIGTWAEVEMFREKGAWGATLCAGSGTWIIIDYDHHRMLEVLTA